MSTNPPPPVISLLIYGPVVSGALYLLWRNGYSLAPDAFVLNSLAAAAFLWLIGLAFFGGRFVKPVWKAHGKGLGFLVFCYLTLTWLGPWAWVLIGIHLGIGIVFYFIICHRHGIDWRRTEPRREFLDLMEKFGRGEFR